MYAIFCMWSAKYTVQGLCKMFVVYCMLSAKYTVQDLVAVNYTVLFWPHLTSTWNRIVNKYVQLKGISDLFKKKLISCSVQGKRADYYF